MYEPLGDIITQCRICLKYGEMIPILYTMETTAEALISDMINLCCGLQVSPNAALPSNICYSCLFDLRIAFNLRKTAERSDEILRAALEPQKLLSGDGNALEELQPDSFLVTSDGDDLIVEETLIEELESKPNDVKMQLQTQDPNPEEGSVEVVDETDDLQKKAVKGSKRSLFCEECQKSFSRPESFTSHMRRHRNEKTFQCSVCEKSFVNKFELTRHVRVHTRDRPYPCQFCYRTFADFTSRERHHNVHTQKRPYTCTTCGKGFNYSSVLQAHLTTHTGEKKFKCSVCDRTFSQKHHLTAHAVLHSRRSKRPGPLIEQELKNHN